MAGPVGQGSDYRAAGEAFTRQAGLIHDSLAQRTAEDFAVPSVLPGWDVATLVGHLVLMQNGLVDRLALVQKGVKALAVADYVALYAGAADEISDRTRDVRAAHEQAELLRALKDSADPRQRLELVAPTEVLAIPGRGPLQVIDWLETRIAELVVHADDLSRSLPAHDPIALDRQALARTCRLFMRILATRAPGRAVEVRVPPFAAAQILQGPKHTRGTPPNVVEMAPISWVRLATGRANWDLLVAGGAIKTSGMRGDISELLPLFT